MSFQIKICNRKARAQIKKYQEDGWYVIDVTSKSPTHSQFSPFYPHGGITINDYVSESVEGLWQGLKVFESTGIDTSKFKITNMKNLKRTCAKYGKVIGHQYNSYNGNAEIIDYITARHMIYIPTYNQVLYTKLQKELNEFRAILCDPTYKGIVFLDYDTNEDPNDATKPLSHASLIKKHLEQTY